VSGHPAHTARHSSPTRRSSDLLTAGKPEQSGWKLVPEEPTEEMYRAVYKVQDDCAIHNYGASPTFDDYWSAALSASPTPPTAGGDRKSTRLNSSHVKISYAVFC